EVLIRRIAPGWRATRFAGVLGTMLLVLVIVSLGLGSSPAQARFNLGLQDDGFGPGASAAQTASAYGAMSTIHGSYVRIPLEWTQVVGSTSAFDQANPADTHYGWEKVDPAVRSAAEHHLKMILVIDRAPSWAQGPGSVKPYVSDGAWNPDP